MTSTHGLFIFAIVLISSRINGTTYNFFRDVRPESYTGTRRIFGGNTAPIEAFPQICLLTDKAEKPKCSGSIVTYSFVVTAAHCIQPTLRYIFYNSRTPMAGHSTKIARIYRHPDYLMTDEGRGPDIVTLYHDIGLVESSEAMIMAFPTVPQRDDLETLRTRKSDLSQVDVLGFGITDTPGQPELLSVTLQVNPCFRGTWKECTCGQSRPGEQARGVCSGDSGGPVVHEGTLVGVTSMGPSDCSSKFDPTMVSTSVFTMISSYLDMINNTMSRRGGGMTELKLSNGNALKSSSASLSYIIYELTHIRITFNIYTWMIALFVLKFIK